jgi:hypothetical protein
VLRLGGRRKDPSIDLDGACVDPFPTNGRSVGAEAKHLSKACKRRSALQDFGEVATIYRSVFPMSSTFSILKVSFSAAACR